ncbi:hypothetical protein MTO96_008291 [Rhipicephalus appendiculatus]
MEPTSLLAAACCSAPFVPPRVSRHSEMKETRGRKLRFSSRAASNCRSAPKLGRAKHATGRERAAADASASSSFIRGQRSESTRHTGSRCTLRSALSLI